MVRDFKMTTVLLLLGFSIAGFASADSLVIEGEIVHTLAGDAIEGGVVVVEDGKIVAVGPAGEVSVPEAARKLTAKVVTPGLIDAHTVVGLAGWLNQDHDQDQLETSDPIQPELRAIDAYNTREALVAWLRGFGVTTIHTGHGPGALVSGQTMIAKTHGSTVDDVVLVPAAMIAATLGEGATREGGKPPGTRSKAAAMLRSELVKAQAYAEKTKTDEGSEGKSKKKSKAKEDEEPKSPARDLRLEAMVRVLDGELPLLVTVQRHQDIMTALRIREEFGFRLVLDGAAEAHLLVDEIRESGVPVIVHATMKRAFGEAESLSWETAGILAEAGIPIALQSGYESYVPKTRVVLFEAAIAAANGLGRDGALRAMTLGAAEILGIEDRVGSIEVGKDADLALYDGDPFEYTSHCVGVVIDGEVVSEEIR